MGCFNKNDVDFLEELKRKTIFRVRKAGGKVQSISDEFDKIIHHVFLDCIINYASICFLRKNVLFILFVKYFTWKKILNQKLTI